MYIIRGLVSKSGECICKFDDRHVDFCFYGVDFELHWYPPPNVSMFMRTERMYTFSSYVNEQPIYYEYSSKICTTKNSVNSYHQRKKDIGVRYKKGKNTHATVLYYNNEWQVRNLIKVDIDKINDYL